MRHDRIRTWAALVALSFATPSLAVEAPQWGPERPAGPLKAASKVERLALLDADPASRAAPTPPAPLLIDTRSRPIEASTAPPAQDAPGQDGLLAILIRNPRTADGAPPFALTDDYGRVRRYVEPTPGVDLDASVGQRVRVRHDTGQTLLASQLELPQGLRPLAAAPPLADARQQGGPQWRDATNRRRRSPRPGAPRGLLVAAQYQDSLPEDLPPFRGSGPEPTPALDQPLDAPDTSPLGGTDEEDTTPIVLEDVIGEASQDDAEDDTPLEPVPLESLPNGAAASGLRHTEGPDCPACRAHAEAQSKGVAASCKECASRESGACKVTCSRCGASTRPLLSGCCLGDPYRVSDELLCECSPWDFGFWTQLGYHSNNTRFSTTDNDALAFNDHPDRINLHQQWFWLERVADASDGMIDWGFRMDLMYGADAASTQSFGNPAGKWDFANGWDEGGGYGWALPQLYGELAWDDWSLIAGHFYTLVGYEVVTAPDNFFYSHAYTMYNSEPFTHTGLLATYSGVEGLDIYAGYTLGWDSGFEQSNDGSNFIGGLSTGIGPDVTFTYITTIGNFGARSAGESGYSHSLVFDMVLTPEWSYVLQSDLVGYDDNLNAGFNDQVGLNQYLFYTASDCLAYGMRFEWWKTDGLSFYEATVGMNYRPHANLVFRPELRYDWSPSTVGAQAAGLATADDFNQLTFGVDAVLVY
ncbi:hypothetical protein Mal64_16460 [Pseudobythopirellula maris]|uniref:Uncharacterized protein n=1 Tax=Pseudobythopirellula maris TaxID=2527991 RepID=A0A5C5ZL96_9BACT|nr:porin [Pseudobythopirellula maris]TWT88169.1 hypothetical protein Mal64_16460 [Pseudobythopirellula maris]